MPEDSSTPRSARRGLAGAPAAFLRRSPAERRALLRLLPALLRIEAGLRRSTPVPRLAASLGVRLGVEPDAPPLVGAASMTKAERAGMDAARRLVRRWPVEARCLRRSLLVGHALRSRSPVLRIGVARDEGGAVHAHAWIEIDGVAPEDLERHVDFRPLRRARRA